MQQLRLGLEDDVDVSVYANPKLSHLVMLEIRLGLLDNIDFSVYLEDQLRGFLINTIISVKNSSKFSQN